ncbi:MAG: hypothetical protein IT305_01600 [Chloroflexi bacterium]|nr:hypothetical protein [Chloroflexota bacterium]
MTARPTHVVRSLLVALAVAIASVSAIPPGHASHLAGLWDAPAAFAQAASHLSQFTGAPTSPTPWRGADWDVVVHSRDISTWDTLDPMQATHGADCAGAPASHTISRYEDAVFQCRDHIMTAINAPGYGAIVLTPNQLVDFSAGEAVVRFDISTMRTSGRDWWDLWLTPYDDSIQIPLHRWMPDLAGEPRNGMQIEMNQFNGGTIFRGAVVRDFNVIDLDHDWTAYESFLTPSAVRRDTYELRISRTHVKFGLPAYNHWWIDAPIQDLGWDRAVLQLGHHSYNPQKDCDPTQCQPNTWHWDNVSISPAQPFTMVKSDRRVATAETGGVVGLTAPAPAGGQVRFSAIGRQIEVKFDNGPWQPARRQPVMRDDEGAFQPYWMPIPPGTRQMTFRGQPWWGSQPWRVADVSAWSLTPPSATQPPAPTPPPSATPAPSPSPSPSPNPFPSPSPVGCDPRPPFKIVTSTTTKGELKVVVSVTSSSALPDNSLRGILFGRSSNASIASDDRLLSADGARLDGDTGVRQLTFTVRRTREGMATTVPLTLFDDCGQWSTFVGGGPNAF